MDSREIQRPRAFLATLLAFVLAFCMVPAPAFAEDPGASATAEAEANNPAKEDRTSQESTEDAGEVPRPTPEAEGSQVPNQQNGTPAPEETPSPSEPGASEPEPIFVPKPQGKTLTFNGEWQLGVDPAEGWVFACPDGLDSTDPSQDHFDQETGCRKHDAGEYSCILRLKDGYAWEDGSKDDAVVAWSIQPKAIPVPQGATLHGNGQPQQGAVAGEGYQLTGETEATEPGDYTATATLLPNYIWEDGTTDARQIAWKIEAPTKNESIAGTQSDTAQGGNDPSVQDDSISMQALTYIPTPNGGAYEIEGYEFALWYEENVDRYLYDLYGEIGDYPSAEITCDTLLIEDDPSTWEPGYHYITYTPLKGYCWPDGSRGSKTITLELLYDYASEGSFLIEDCAISLGYERCTYSGKAKRPSVWIQGYKMDPYSGSTYWETLEKGVDYTVTYSNNVNAGRGTVTIKGIGDYSGSVKKTFKINPKSITRGTVSLNRSRYVANGTLRKPSPSLSINGKYLQQGVDYKVAYSNNRNAGEAMVVLQGIGNYKGTINQPFMIYPRNTGWFKYDGSWYYKTRTGLASGWKSIGGAWYYFNKNTNAMRLGKIVDGRKVYFTDKNGAMKSSCWHKSGGKWYYLSSSGAARSGWLSSGGTWYYLDPASKAMQTGLKKIDGKRYYFNSSGAMKSNYWKMIGGHWYYFTGSGAAKRGWLKWGSDWYWFDSAGKSAMDCTKKIDGNYHFFYDDGRWVSSLPEGARGLRRLTITQTYTSGAYCKENDYYYFIDSRGNLAGMTGSWERRIGRYLYHFDSNGRAYARQEVESGIVESWIHDDCSYSYGCSGRYWYSDGEYDWEFESYDPDYPYYPY